MVDSSCRKYLAIAGALLFIAGVGAVLGIITGETLYPGYSTSQNEISDLGATRPPNSIIHQPSATIFNTTMIITGLLIIGAAASLYNASVNRLNALVLALFGISVTGVGIFPGNYGNIHAIFALLTFVSGGVAALLTYRVTTSPFRYFSAILGAIALTFLILYIVVGQSSPFAILGQGGVERWVVYPVVLWSIGYGGYLMGAAPDNEMRCRNG
jgi:hypothetical membrane protein